MKTIEYVVPGFVDSIILYIRVLNTYLFKTMFRPNVGNSTDINTNMSIIIIM